MNQLGWFKVFRTHVCQLVKSQDQVTVFLLLWLNTHYSDDFEISVRTASIDTGIPKTTLHRSLTKLQKIGAIELAKTSNGLFVKILTDGNNKENKENLLGTLLGQKMGHQMGQQVGQQEQEVFDEITECCDVEKEVSGTASGTASGTVFGRNVGQPLYRSKNTRINKNNKTSPEAPKKPKSREVISAYKEAYHAKYGVEPLLNAKTNSIGCKLVDAVGEETAIEIVRHYLNSQDKFITAKKHPISLCLSNVETFATEVAMKKQNLLGGVKFGSYKPT